MSNDILAQHLAAAQFAKDTEVIRGEFPQIFAEADLANLAHLNVQKHLADDTAHGRYRPPLEVYRAAANDTLRLANRVGEGAARRRGGENLNLGAETTEDEIERHRRAAVREIMRERGHVD